ncbi:MAG: hypothetical protein G01um101438_444 [Parcubacteria group bacterium Gr01-1014_38]|nr:MAG: hypothetical protein G01um101438_444 [Parcubacteria group bacterium Gr01-1014_38]
MLACKAMVKQKTHKAAAKRFVRTKRGKFLRRYTQQDHFNVGRSKKTLRGRRRDRTVAASDVHRLTRQLPFGLS